VRRPAKDDYTGRIRCEVARLSKRCGTQRQGSLVLGGGLGVVVGALVALKVQYGVVFEAAPVGGVVLGVLGSRELHKWRRSRYIRLLGRFSSSIDFAALWVGTAPQHIDESWVEIREALYSSEWDRLGSYGARLLRRTYARRASTQPVLAKDGVVRNVAVAAVCGNPELVRAFDQLLNIKGDLYEYDGGDHLHLIEECLRHKGPGNGLYTEEWFVSGVGQGLIRLGDLAEKYGRDPARWAMIGEMARVVGARDDVMGVSAAYNEVESAITLLERAGAVQG
jgi:hypothetical protein